LRPAFGARGCPVFTNCHGRRLQSCKALRLAGGLRFSAPDVLPMTPSAEQGRGSGAMGTRSRLHHRPHHHVQSDPLPYHIAAKNRPASSCSCFHSPQPDPAARGRAPLADRGLRRGVQLLGAAAPARARPAAGTAGAGPSAAGRANLATASKAQDDSAEEDVESIFSHAVLEAEIRECDEQLAKLESTGGWGIDEVQVRRDGLDLRRQSIEDQIECHILSQEAYVAKVKAACRTHQRPICSCA